MRTENVELIKEQLRAKSRELKKRDNEKARHEAKIRHVLDLSKQKITDLKTMMAQKEEMLQSAEAVSASLAFKERSSGSKGDGEGEEEEDQLGFKTAPSSDDANEKEPKVIIEKVIETVVETREIHVKDPKLVKALKILKLKYQALNERVESHKFEKEQLTKERGMLSKEVKRLKKEPDQMDKVKGKIAQIEERSKQTQEKFEKLLKDKNDLIQSYEATLFKEEGEGGEDSKLPSEIIKELKADLDELTLERDKLTNNLIVEKKRFDEKLSEELKKIEEELGGKIKKLGRANTKLGKGQALEEEEGAPLWMVTFADMVTLMLTFFILMYSISAVNMNKMKEAILGEESASIGLLELLDSVKITQSIRELTGMKTDDIISEVEDSTIESDTSKSKIVLRIPGASLFAPGKALLQKEGLPMLDEVIRITQKYSNYLIHIQGHTDDEQIHSEMFPTNWELSAARATAVLRYFIDKNIDPEKLTATGYADTFPLATNNTKLGRAKNRRVEFVLEKEK